MALKVTLERAPCGLLKAVLTIRSGADTGGSCPAKVTWRQCLGPDFSTERDVVASDQGLLIAGEQQESSTGETYDDVNPYTGAAIATIAAASPDDATRAVDAAAVAFKAWSQTSPAERRAVFLRAAQLVKERTSDVIATMTPETGATFGWGMFMVHLAEGMFLEAAAAAMAPIGEVNATNDVGALSLTIRRSAGVVAAFSPWNAPTYLSARAVGIPLAVGNTVVLKATEEAPISAGSAARTRSSSSPMPTSTTPSAPRLSRRGSTAGKCA
jgi:acyl-CoA reductase-like NAD-dependent aldehyde dehydrogenase